VPFQKITDKITEKKTDYIISVKDNQKTIQDEVKDFLTVYAKRTTVQNATPILYSIRPQCCTECGRNIAGFAHPMLYRMGSVH